MNPQPFLQTFWRLEVKPQVFVAMSFQDKYQSRFENVIAPAIRAISVDGVNLEPYRVDLSKTGDSILMEIIDGIAHSQLVLADVSTVGRDSESGESYRNGNVMYEVGLALACRTPSEVLLIRDDDNKFLFDVSSIPHLTIDFNKKSAVSRLRDALRDRLKVCDYTQDARVKLALASLTVHEIERLIYFAGFMKDDYRKKSFESYTLGATTFLVRLLDKQLIRRLDQASNKMVEHELTPLGYAVAKLANEKDKIP